MKTPDEFLHHHYIHDNGLENTPEYIINAMKSFADQEKAALKDRLMHEATVDSIIWEVLQIDRMSNQEFDSERERRHLQIRKVQEILKSI